MVGSHGDGGTRVSLTKDHWIEHHDHGHSHSHGRDSPADADGDGQSASEELQPLHLHADHRHTQCEEKKPGRDLNMLGVMIHVIGDALNNIGVIIAALIIWKTSYNARYYADPAAGIGISLMIFLSSIPLVKNSGTILLQSAPQGVDLGDIKHDLEDVGCPRAYGQQEYMSLTDWADSRHRIGARTARLAVGPEESDSDGARDGVGPVRFQLHGEGEDG